jgi:hypothetical protein
VCGSRIPQGVGVEWQVEQLKKRRIVVCAVIALSRTIRRFFSWLNGQARGVVAMRTVETPFVDDFVDHLIDRSYNRGVHPVSAAFDGGGHQRYVWQAKPYSMPKARKRRFKGGELRMLPRPYLPLSAILILLIAITPFSSAV